MVCEPNLEYLASPIPQHRRSYNLQQDPNAVNSRGTPMRDTHHNPQVAAAEQRHRVSNEPRHCAKRLTNASHRASTRAVADISH